MTVEYIDVGCFREFAWHMTGWWLQELIHSFCCSSHVHQ